MVQNSDQSREIQELRSRIWELSGSPSKIVFPVLITAGFISLAAAYFESSMILTYIGLVLVLWGAVLSFSSQINFVRADILFQISASTLRTIEELLSEMKLAGKTIYLVPRSLEELQNPKSFVLKNASDSEDFLRKNQFTIEEADGKELVPLGQDLAKYLENQLGQKFSTMEFENLTTNLPNALTKAFQLFESVTIDRRDSLVEVIMNGKLGSRICSDSRAFNNLHEVVGCPICSSIGIALAQSLGKPVMMENSKIANESIANRYRILD